MKKQLLLIDGTAYIYRAFHAIPHLSNSKGLPTNAVYGFARMLLKVIKDFKTDHIAVAFDVKGPSFRHKMYEEYKAHRPEMPDSLKPQIPYIKELVKAFNIPVLELEGYEADDVIGTISKQMKEKDVEVIIIAADKDMLQLIDENTTIVDTMKDNKFGIKEVMERFGTKPEQIVEIMGLAGDSSDNIPGVKGIGEKTAVKLIKEFGSIENLLLNIDKVREKGLREKLGEYAEDARLSRALAVIDKNAPVDYRFEDLAVQAPDYQRLKELLKEMEFTKLLNEIIPDERSDIKGEYTCVTDIDKLKDLTAKVKEAGEAAIVIKKQGGAIFGELTGLAVCIKPGQAFYIPTGHRYLGAPSQIDRRLITQAIKPIIEDEGIKKISHDIKAVHIFFKQQSIQMRGAIFDTSIASYLLNPSRSNYNIEDIAHEQIGHKMAQFKEAAFEDVDMNTACSRACAEA
ncbi:MAG TPA: 5'-3' exonuclease H3TH domain-containing protein, partial [Thermodesulfobacteriota bacterium]|nr:5'-3' exonuclease H3TH domain-containing protein [Thermodesulfobacteriota bacterium]